MLPCRTSQINGTKSEKHPYHFIDVEDLFTPSLQGHYEQRRSQDIVIEVVTNISDVLVPSKPT
jgi:hypothetical protein